MKLLGEARQMQIYPWLNSNCTQALYFCRQSSEDWSVAKTIFCRLEKFQQLKLSYSISMLLNAFPLHLAQGIPSSFQTKSMHQKAADKGKRMESLGCRRKTALVCYQDVVLKQHKQDMSKIVWIIWTSFSDVKPCNIKTTVQSVWVVRTFSWYGCSRFLVRSNRLCKKQCNHKN